MISLLRILSVVLPLAMGAVSSLANSASSAPVQLVAGWDFDTTTQSSISLASAMQSSRQYNANFGTNNGTIPRLLFDGTQGSSRWNNVTSNTEMWTANGTQTNLLPGSSTSGSNISLQLRGGSGLTANGKSLVFLLDMTKARRLEITYAATSTSGGFTTHTWEYWDDNGKAWLPITHKFGTSPILVPSTFETIELDQVGGIGFNNRRDARVRLTVNGATTVGGTNLLDNIRFNATVGP
jgi:hypothetical protein